MKLAHTLMAGAALAVLTASAAPAADLLGPVDPIYESPLFDFEGLYVGATGGGAFTGTGYGTLGLVVGANFAVTDGIIAGVEFQGDALWNGGGFIGFDALFLGKLGGYLSDETIIYGTGGGGWIAGTPSYAIGAGIEAAIAEQLSVRGEALATGSWGAWPNGGKATVGVLWHMN